MNARRPLSALACTAATVLALLVASAPADAAINKRCGGKHAKRVDATKNVIVVVRSTVVEDDLYGDLEEDYLACVGERGKARTLTGHGTSTSETLNRVKFSGHHVALEFIVSDNTCGKYDPTSPCTAAYSIASYNAKTGRPVSAMSSPSPVTTFAVSPTGALVWLRPASNATNDRVLQYLLGYSAVPTTIATGEFWADGLGVGRSEIRWTDVTGPRTAPIPAPTPTA